MAGGIDTTKSGSASAHIKFVSTEKYGAKIVASGTGAAWIVEGDYVDIDGFDISGEGRLGLVAYGSNLSFTNNFIHDLQVKGGCNGGGGAGILTSRPDPKTASGYVIIDRNIVRNIGPGLAGGINHPVSDGTECKFVQGVYIANEHITVTNNIISGIPAVGINQGHFATDSTIVNNTIFHNKIGLWMGQGDSDGTPNGSDNNFIANNIIYDSSVYGVKEVGRRGPNTRYVANLVCSSGQEDWVDISADHPNSPISCGPLPKLQFANYKADGSGDYRLAANSLGIDLGTSENAPQTDFTGASRRLGGGIDIGAYEQ